MKLKFLKHIKWNPYCVPTNSLLWSIKIRFRWHLSFPFQIYLFHFFFYLVSRPAKNDQNPQYNWFNLFSISESSSAFYFCLFFIVKTFLLTLLLHLRFVDYEEVVIQCTLWTILTSWFFSVSISRFCISFSIIYFEARTKGAKKNCFKHKCYCYSPLFN